MEGLFAVLAGLALASLVGLLLAIPTERRPATSGASSFGPGFRMVLGNLTAAAALRVAGLVMLANEQVSVVYGSWMERSFDLSVGRLGRATAIIGVADILDELAVGGLVDRIGKQLSVGIGPALTAAGYAALPLVSTGLPAALVCLFFLFLCFEFTIVATIPVAPELVLTPRGTTMPFGMTASSLGRGAGAPLGPVLWTVRTRFSVGSSPLRWNGFAAGGIRCWPWACCCPSSASPSSQLPALGLRPKLGLL